MAIPRRDTEQSNASTLAGSPPGSSVAQPKKTVYNLDQVHTPMASIRDVKRIIAETSNGDEAPLLPRVFLRSKELGASPSAHRLMSQVRCCNAPHRSTHALRSPFSRARNVALYVHCVAQACALLAQART